MSWDLVISIDLVRHVDGATINITNIMNLHQFGTNGPNVSRLFNTSWNNILFAVRRTEIEWIEVPTCTRWHWESWPTKMEVDIWNPSPWTRKTSFQRNNKQLGFSAKKKRFATNGVWDIKHIMYLYLRYIQYVYIQKFIHIHIQTYVYVNKYVYIYIFQIAIVYHL